MSRTRRIYNNRRLKKTPRIDIDDGKIHLRAGIPLTYRSWICMGKCPMCRDPEQEPRAKRNKLKEKIRFQLIQELSH